MQEKLLDHIEHTKSDASIVPDRTPHLLLDSSWKANLHSPGMNNTTQGREVSANGSYKEGHQKLNLLAVYDDIRKGMADELVHHPLHVAEEAAIGVGAAVGLSLLAPEAAVAVGIGLTALTAYNFYENSKSWWHAERIVSGAEKSTPSAMMAADKELEDLGAGTVDLAAASLGGLAAVRGGVGRVGFTTKPAPPEPPRPGIRPPKEDWTIKYPDLDKKDPHSNMLRTEPPPPQPRLSESIGWATALVDQPEFARWDDPERLMKVSHFSRLADSLYPQMPEEVVNAAYRYLMTLNKVDDFSSSSERDEAILKNFRKGAIKRLRLFSEALKD